MYSEDDLLQLSALQHLSFCERQWGLIHLENIWDENPLTVEGNILHERSDEYETEIRPGLRIVRGLRLRSLRLGVSGRTDVVEFHRLQRDNQHSVDVSVKPCGILLHGARGLWIPFPVEYKRGRPKSGNCDKVQLCAQALCLEEMLDTNIYEGALFYGKTRRRKNVTFTAKLRNETISLAERLHKLNECKVTPSPIYGKHCEKCSLKMYCMPEVLSSVTKAQRYIDAIFTEVERSQIT